MSVPYPTKILLAYRSGDKCALPECGQKLSPTGECGIPSNVGETAHIAGEHAGGSRGQPSARYDPNMTDDERNAYHNLVYVCATCHRKIDAIPQGESEYPVERLREIKSKHERKVREAIQEAFADVGFPELEEATKWIVQVSPQQTKSDFSLIPPEDKLNRNELGDATRNIIVMGLSVSGEVGKFIEIVTQTDSGFPERLKAGFLEEYYRLKHEGHSGDDLFDMMCRFAERGFGQQANKTAGLAVLIYLFETCEVFEK